MIIILVKRKYKSGTKNLILFVSSRVFSKKFNQKRKLNLKTVKNYSVLKMFKFKRLIRVINLINRS